MKIQGKMPEIHQEDFEVEPFDHMINAENPKMYQKVKYGDYLRESFEKKIGGKNKH